MAGNNCEISGPSEFNGGQLGGNSTCILMGGTPAGRGVNTLRNLHIYYWNYGIDYYDFNGTGFRNGTQDCYIDGCKIDIIKTAMDFNTGDSLRLDWHGSHLDGTLAVMRLNEYIESYHRHPDAKAADKDGNPAGPDTIGLLGWLHVKQYGKVARIGKEVDRLDEDEDAALESELPVDYGRDDLAEDVAYLAQFPQEATAAEIGISERRWRDIATGKSVPREATARRIARAAQEHCSRVQVNAHGGGTHGDAPAERA
jgi:hypothetical protein